MPFVATDDDCDLFVKELGEGPPVVLIHGWPLNADSWEDVALSLANAGFRAISYDRRGFGRSEQTYDGNDYDTFADDLDAVIDQCEAEGAALVGFSMGGGEVARYLSRHGSSKVSKAVLIASVVPFLLKTDNNPDGAPQKTFDDMLDGLTEDRAGFLQDFAKQFYGVGMFSKPVSQGVLDWTFQMAMQAGLRGTIECVKAFSSTDFREDCKAFDVPTMILHGTGDAIVPIDISARKAAQLIPHAELIEYDGGPHGLLATHKEEVARDLISFLRNEAASERQALFGRDEETIITENALGIAPTLQPLI
ncbi:MAG: alpha/beta hydrolase [Sphingomonadales bacterium]